MLAPLNSPKNGLPVNLRYVCLGAGWFRKRSAEPDRILGAVAFYWQYRQRRARRIKFLNGAVFRPWNKVEVKHRHRSVNGRPSEAIRLAIPVEAVPKDVDPMVGSEGLDIEKLPGVLEGGFLRAPPLSRFSGSERALRARCREAWREWRVAAEWVQKYEAARERRRSLLEGMVATDMASTYPTLRPVTYHEVALNTYVLASILARTEDESDWSVRPGYTRVRLEASRSSDGEGGFVREINDSFFLLRASEQIVADASAFNRLRDSWADAPAVKELTKEMTGYLDELGKAVAGFRDVMTYIAFRMDLEFPADG